MNKLLVMFFKGKALWFSRILGEQLFFFGLSNNEKWSALKIIFYKGSFVLGHLQM